MTIFGRQDSAQLSANASKAGYHAASIRCMGASQFYSDTINHTASHFIYITYRRNQ